MIDVDSWLHVDTLSHPDTTIDGIMTKYRHLAHNKWRLLCTNPDQHVIELERLNAAWERKYDAFVAKSVAEQDAMSKDYRNLLAQSDEHEVVAAELRKQLAVLREWIAACPENRIAVTK